MKNAYYKLLKAKKTLTKSMDNLTAQYNELVFQEDNEIALALVEHQEDEIRKALKTVNSKMKEIRESISEDELKEWAKDWKNQQASA